MSTFTGPSLNSHKAPRKSTPLHLFTEQNVVTGPAKFQGSFVRKALVRVAWTPHRVAKLSEKQAEINGKVKTFCPLLRDVRAVNAARNRDLEVRQGKKSWELWEAGVCLARGSERDLADLLNAKDARGEYVIPAKPSRLMQVDEAPLQSKSLSEVTHGVDMGYGNLWEATMMG